MSSRNKRPGIPYPFLLLIKTPLRIIILEETPPQRRILLPKNLLQNPNGLLIYYARYLDPLLLTIIIHVTQHKIWQAWKILMFPKLIVPHIIIAIFYILYIATTWTFNFFDSETVTYPVDSDGDCKKVLIIGNRVGPKFPWRLRRIEHSWVFVPFYLRGWSEPGYGGDEGIPKVAHSESLRLRRRLRKPRHLFLIRGSPGCWWWYWFCCRQGYHHLGYCCGGDAGRGAYEDIAGIGRRHQICCALEARWSKIGILNLGMLCASRDEDAWVLR